MRWGFLKLRIISQSKIIAQVKMGSNLEAAVFSSFPTRWHLKTIIMTLPLFYHEKAKKKTAVSIAQSFYPPSFLQLQCRLSKSHFNPFFSWRGVSDQYSLGLVVFCSISEFSVLLLYSCFHFWRWPWCWQWSLMGWDCLLGRFGVCKRGGSLQLLMLWVQLLFPLPWPLWSASCPFMGMQYQRLTLPSFDIRFLLSSSILEFLRCPSIGQLSLVCCIVLFLAAVSAFVTDQQEYVVYINICHFGKYFGKF